MRNLFCLLFICVLVICLAGCCNSLGKGAWNDNLSGFWSWRTGATTAPESATFANQGLYLGQQGRYISPPSSEPAVVVPSNVTTPLPNATPTPEPVVIPSTLTPTTIPNSTPNTTPDSIPTSIPTSRSSSLDPFSAVVPSTVPATPTFSDSPSNYFTASNSLPSDQLQNFNAPSSETALPMLPIANNANNTNNTGAGSISSTESLFAPTHNYESGNNSNSTTFPNVASINNVNNNNQNQNQNNSNSTNINVPLTAYEIASAGTAETAYQSMETRAGTQIKTSQNGVTTITTTSSSPVTSSSHFVTEIKQAE
ncbi:MAG: hypothetical protein LBB88_08430 [Planctomycetaceae bacterium]|jgi:hypothetical protein|nr:hypothetical protein [Planctomycetaceae bacterium]